MALGEKVEAKGTGDDREAGKQGRSEEGTLECKGLTVMDAEKGWGPS